MTVDSEVVQTVDVGVAEAVGQVYVTMVKTRSVLVDIASTEVVKVAFEVLLRVCVSTVDTAEGTVERMVESLSTVEMRVTDIIRVFCACLVVKLVAVVSIVLVEIYTVLEFNDSVLMKQLHA